MKTAITCLVVALAAASARVPAVAASAEPASYMERSERTVETAGLREVAVENARGRVEFVPSADRRIHFVVTKACRMATQAESRRLAASVTVNAGPGAAGRFEVIVRYPKRLDTSINFWDLFSEAGRRRAQMRPCEVVVQVQLPDGLAARATTASGDVSAEGIAGALTAETASGDVTARGLRAPVTVRTASGDVTLEGAAAGRVETASGDVHVRGAAGPIDVATASGDIEIERAPGGVKAHAASGGIVVRAAAGEVEVASQSGDVAVTLAAGAKRVAVSTASGDARVTLPAGLGATVDASTSSGGITCNGDVAVLGHSAHRITARVGDGAAKVGVESASGDVTISSGGK